PATRLVQTLPVAQAPPDRLEHQVGLVAGVRRSAAGREAAVPHLVPGPGGPADPGAGHYAEVTRPGTLPAAAFRHCGGGDTLCTWAPRSVLSARIENLLIGCFSGVLTEA